MVQTTLDAFLTPASPSAEDSLDAQQLGSHAPPRQQHINFARLIVDRACGMGRHTTPRSRLQQLQPCVSHRQVACLQPPLSMDPQRQQHAVTGMAVNQATGSVAWVQGNGTLQVSSMARLQQAAWECEQRAAEAAARQKGQASSSGRGPDSPLEEEEEEGQGLGSGATSQATCFRRRQAWLAGTSSTLPPAKRYNAGSRLEDVAFDPSTTCKLALAGSVGPSTNVLLLDLGKASPTYQRLVVPKQPHARMTGVRYLSSSHRYSLAASDRRAVYLWDVRKGSANAAELPAPAPLVSGVQALAGTSLVCAVTEQQQLMVWDLRQGTTSSGVQMLGGAGLFQHAVLACKDLSAPLSAAHASLAPTAASSRPSRVQAAAAHPCDSSSIALLLMNLSTAVYSLSHDSITHLAMSPSLFHAGTDPAAQQAAIKAVSGGSHVPKCSWDASGSTLWSPSPVVKPWDPHTFQHTLPGAAGDGGGGGSAGTLVAGRSHLPPQVLQQQRHAPNPSSWLVSAGSGGWEVLPEGFCGEGQGMWPGAGVLDYHRPPGPRTRGGEGGQSQAGSISAAGASGHLLGLGNNTKGATGRGEAAGGPFGSWQASGQALELGMAAPSSHCTAEELRSAAFECAKRVPGLGEVAAALRTAGADPCDLLLQPATSAAYAAAGGGGGGAGGGDEERASVGQLGEVWGAVRRWEDRVRYEYGPGQVVMLSDWPTCFASWASSEDMLMGTRSGNILLARPGRAAY